jgi:hypothetical protein
VLLVFVEPESTVCGLTKLTLEVLEDHLIPIEYLKRLPSQRHRHIVGFGAALAVLVVFVAFTVNSKL